MRIRPGALLLDQRPFLLQRQESAGSWGFPRHGHAGFAEIVHLERGILDHEHAGRHDRLTAGALLLIRPQDEHACSGSGLCHWNLNLRAEELGRAAAFLSDGARLRRLLAAAAPPAPVVVPPAERAGLAEELRALERRRDQPDEMRRYERLLVGLLHRFLDDAGEGGALPGWLTMAMADAAADPVRAAPGRMARQAGVSLPHLSRSMRRLLGVAPAAWLIRLRLERAALRLCEDDAPVSAIASACGFRQAAYFDRRFRGAYGLTPTAYRTTFGLRDAQR